MKDIQRIVRFTVRNLENRIEKAEFRVRSFEFDVENCTKNGDISKAKEAEKELIDSYEILHGYREAVRRVKDNGSISKDNVFYIMKSLEIRTRILNRLESRTTDLIEHHNQVLKNKSDTHTSTAGLGIVIRFDEDTSKSLVADSKERLDKIKEAKIVCEKAKDFFEYYL